MKLTEARRLEEQRRRESVINRGITVQQQRVVVQNMEQAKRQAETDMLQFRRYLGLQKAASAAEEERRTRESLAGRLQTWRAHRTVGEQQLSVIEEEERDLLDSKYSDWKDTKQHQNNIEHQRRQSLGEPSLKHPITSVTSVTTPLSSSNHPITSITTPLRHARTFKDLLNNSSNVPRSRSHTPYPSHLLTSPPLPLNTKHFDWTIGEIRNKSLKKVSNTLIPTYLPPHQHTI